MAPVKYDPCPLGLPAEILTAAHIRVTRCRKVKEGSGK